MRLLLRLALYPTVLLGGTAAADEGAGHPDRPPVERLVEQLGDANFRTREAAGKELARRGEEALPALRRAARDGRPEVRRRAAVLAAALERKVLFAPKRVTLHFEQRPIADVVREIARQTGYNLQLPNPPEFPVTVHLDDVPYWEAIDRLCTVGGLVYNWDDSDGTARLHAQDAVCPYVWHRGPFRMVANNVTTNRTLNLAFLPRNGWGQNQPPEYLNLAFDVYSEPKVPLLGVGQPRLTRAEDQAGRSLLPRPQGEGEFYPVFYQPNYFRSHQQQVAVPLFRPSRDSTRARLVRGTVPVTVLSEQRPEITVEKIRTVKDARFAGAGAELHVEEVNWNNGVLQLTLRVNRRGKGNPEDYGWANSLQQRLVVVDAQGKQYQTQINNFMNITPQGIRAGLTFTAPPGQKVGPPERLVFHRWLSLTHEIDFEFKDVPLP